MNPLYRLLLDFTPTDGGSASAPAPAPAPSSAPASSPTPTPTPSAGGAGTGGTRDFAADPSGVANPGGTPGSTSSPVPGSLGGGATDPAAAAAAQQQSQFTSIRQALAERGLAGEWDNDSVAFDELVNLARQGIQNNYYAQLGQAVAPHYQQIQPLLGGQQVQPVSAGQSGPGPYRVPFNREHLKYLQADETGRLVPKPGIVMDPNLVVQANQWIEAVGEWQDTWASDPRKAFQEMFADQVREIVAQHHQQVSAQQQDQGFAQQVQREHGSWIFQRDPQGRVVKDFRTGRPALTPNGAKLLTYVQQAVQAGVRDDRTRFEFAMGQLQRDIALQRLQQLQGQQGQQQSQAGAFGGAGQFGGGATQQPNWTPQQTSAVPQPGQIPASTQGMSIEEMMRQEFRQSGITDADIRNQLAVLG